MSTNRLALHCIALQPETWVTVNSRQFAERLVPEGDGVVENAVAWMREQTDEQRCQLLQQVTVNGQSVAHTARHVAPQLLQLHRREKEKDTC